MWTEKQIAENLRDIGLRDGANVLAHTSLRAIGPMEQGAQTLLNAFRQVLGPTGTLLVPTFSYRHYDPAGWRNPPDSGRKNWQDAAPPFLFDAATTPADVSMGYFAELVRQHPDARRSQHPSLSFAAIGPNADFLTANVPFHYPLGSQSPPARLNQINGYVLLLGVGHDRNTSLHLAEIWADVPYIHRTAILLTAPEQWTTMQGSPECSTGFVKIEPLLRQSRLVQRGTIGNAPGQLMRQQMQISLAVKLLQGDACTLLCDDVSCEWCRRARKLSEP